MNTASTDTPLTPASVPGLRTLIFATAMAQFLLPFMLAGVNPILPAIGRSLGASVMELGIFGAAYSLSLAVFHLLMGRIGDIAGKSRIMLSGVALFTLSAGLMPLMPTPTAFASMRFIQAVGTAMMNTSSLAMLMETSPPEIRGQVIGTSTIGIFIGITAGPTVGGLIADWFGWQWLFYMMVPLGTTVWLLLRLRLPRVQTTAQDDCADTRLDLWGSLLWFAGMTLFAGGATWILKGLWAWAALTAGIFILGGFAVSQYRADKRRIIPILDTKMAIGNPHFLLGSLIAFIIHAGIIGPVFFFALYLQFHFGLDMKSTGLILGIQPLIQLVFVRPSGRLADKYGALNIYTVGVALCTAAMTAACTFGLHTPLRFIAAVLVFNGFGLALFGAPSNTAILSSVEKRYLSQASGLIGTLRTLGMLISMIIASLTINIFLGNEAAGASNVPRLISAMHTSLIIFALMNVAALGMALYLQIRSRRNPHESFAS